MSLAREALHASVRVKRWCALRQNTFGVVPYVVFQMAKVGSSAVVAALERAGLPVFHVHRMDAAHLERMRDQRRALGWSVPPVPPHDLLGLRIRRDLLDRGGRAAIITLVRDPIARNLSSYFEHLDFIHGMADAHEHVPLAALVDRFRSAYTHEEPLTWFDDEMLPATGIDVYDHPFPSSGVQTIRTERRDLLILKAELPDPVKREALESFVGHGPLELGVVNSTADKTKGVAYRQFREAVQLTGAYVDTMLESRYARHFYTDAEREALRQRYLRRG